MILRFPKIVIDSKIINKTQAINNQENSAHLSWNNSIVIKSYKRLENYFRIAGSPFQVILLDELLLNVLHL